MEPGRGRVRWSRDAVAFGSRVPGGRPPVSAVPSTSCDDDRLFQGEQLEAAILGDLEPGNLLERSEEAYLLRVHTRLGAGHARGRGGADHHPLAGDLVGRTEAVAATRTGQDAPGLEPQRRRGMHRGR